MKELSEYVTVSQACELLGVSDYKVRLLLAARGLQVYLSDADRRRPLYRREDVLTLIGPPVPAQVVEVQ